MATSHLYRDKLVIQATRRGDGWTLRYVPLESPKGFKAKLYLVFSEWR